MFQETVTKLAKAKSVVAELEAELAGLREAELADLHTKFGFESVDEFVEAVRFANVGRRGKRSGVKAAKGPGRKRRRRARLTPDDRKAIVAALKAGKTGPEIAKDFGVSQQTVFNIKKAAGLVKAQK